MFKAIKSWVTVSGVLVAAAVTAGLIVIAFGSCGAAVWVATLAPDSTHWKREVLARQLMKLHVQPCISNVSATVIRYCHDESGPDPQKPWATYYEEAMEVDIAFDSHGLTVNTLDLTLEPGVTAGVFVPPINPDSNSYCAAPNVATANCPICGRYAYAPYVEVLDHRTKELKLVEPISSDANTGEWAANYSIEKPLTTSASRLRPIHYYALTSRSKEAGMTCMDKSQPTTVSYSASIENLSSDGKSDPLIRVDNQPIKVTTQVVSWRRLVEDPERSGYFTDKRFVARKQIHDHFQCLDAQHDYKDQSAWRVWPVGFAAEEALYPATRFRFCDRLHCDISE